jgi:hypothetical protein
MCYAGYDEYEKRINIGRSATVQIGDYEVRFDPNGYDEGVVIRIQGMQSLITRFRGKDRAIYTFWQAERHLKGNETVFKVSRSQLRETNQSTQRVGSINDVVGTAYVL